jgi:formate hydrogenlyase subunit 3/multisubunit Na+/H+ antiporter MnhD subunit
MIWLLIILFPGLVACSMGWRRMREFAIHWLMPLAALPALGLAVFGGADMAADVQPFLLGARFGFGDAGQVFLFFTALLWTVAAIYTRSYIAKDERRFRFGFFFLLSMTGNLGLTVAQDAPTFYVFFSMMALAAYPLVIHPGSGEARHAGLVYLVMTILGELLILAAFFLAVAEAGSHLFSELKTVVAGSENRNLIMLLAFVGFGIKAGVLPVHFWLPLAHPVAPVPASAVLSGAMIKAGLLGWIQLMPLGHGAFPGWSSFCIAAGLAACFYAVIMGLAQSDPKTNLAYSSVSQIGVMTIAVGIGFATPDAWQAILPVLLVYALNHALAKGALFLGVGIGSTAGASRWKRGFALAGLGLAALALAGAPWTGGSVAKYNLKVVAGIATSVWYPWLDWLLPLSSVATTLLLTRFLLLMNATMTAKASQSHAPAGGLWMSWILLLVGVVVAAAFSIGFYALEVEPRLKTAGDLWAAVWPVLLGVVLLLALGRLLGKRSPMFHLPPGDIVVWLDSAARRVSAFWDRLPVLTPARWAINFLPLFDRVSAWERRESVAARLEGKLLSWDVAGLGLLLLTALLLLVLL